MTTHTQTLPNTQSNSSWFRTLQCKHATVLTAITFVIAGTTGVMVFFHWGNAYVMGLHEWIGLAMVVAAVVHMTRHFNALGNQLKKPRARVWLAAGALVTALFVGSALLAPSGGNPMKGFVHKSMDAPVSAVGAVLNLSQDDVRARLEVAGMEGIQMDMSVNDLAAFNHVEATTILGAVMGRR